MGAAMLLVCGTALAQAQPSEAGKTADRYLVVLKDDVAGSEQAANGMARRYGFGVGFVYSHALKGFSATIPSERVEKVRADDRVDYVERDGVMRTTAQVLPWGIDRVDADESSTKADNERGAVSNVSIYVIDTGIDKNHTDLNVVHHVNFAGGKNADCDGHGTHVSGTLAAKDNARDVVGVAPGAPLIGVKVLGCDGTGSESTVIKGIDWVTANANKPAIANMSLDGGASRSVDNAVSQSAKSGVLYSVAAGNQAKDACKYSPARAGAGTDNGIVTTAATNKKNAETTISNYGSCVDLWAPGAGILSTEMGGGTMTLSGTSMASPHAGGGAALYFSTHAMASPSSVEGALKAAAARPGTKSKDGRTILLENVTSF
jgi:aqualysin 1